jgi:hypothetical protein
MVLGDVNRTRRLAGNPATTNVSDADITQGLAYGTSQVIRITGKADWETDITNEETVEDKPTADTAAEYFASSMIRDRFNDQTDISTEHFNRAMALATQLADSIVSTAAGGIGIATRAYRSYPLNSSVTAYRSMLSQGQELVGIEVYTNLPQ